MKRFRLPVLFACICAATVLAQTEEQIRSRIRRQPVISSNVASVGYSKQLHALEIEFRRGAIYRFLDVPATVHRGLMSAQSKGHFVAENIRGKYRFVRVRSSPSSVSSSSQLARKSTGSSGLPSALEEQR